MKNFRIQVFLLLLVWVFSAHAEVVINPKVVVGKIKPMNAVNNGPTGSSSDLGDQARDNYELYRAARIPFARTHDANHSAAYGGPHTVDITAVFPDFSKDVNDPKSYDFAITDWYLKRIRMVGTEVFYRLGQSIEHWVKKYGIYPPKDYKKWAQICEHIIRHYNEGWADGYHWNIRFWEIWNEPDMDQNRWDKNPTCWGGSEEEFFKFYAIASKHLKKCFPDLMIGGPASMGDWEWGARFLTYMKKEGAAVDFYSWHRYDYEPSRLVEIVHIMRNMMEENGFGDKLSILNEWNYIRGWEDEYPYSGRTMANHKGAAFCAAVMTACQDAPVDMLMYYDARPGCLFNGLFDFVTLKALPTYYSLYAWSKLAGLGTQIQAKVEDEENVYAVAAKGDNGKNMAMVTFYTDNDNISAPKKVKARLEGCTSSEVIAHVVDAYNKYTETTLLVEDGVVKLTMEPNSIFTIEW